MQLPKNYSINVDVLRIISGFGVVLIHVTDPFIVFPPLLGVKGLSWEILNIINTLFKCAVPLFIMLSGLLILTPSKTFDFGQFFKKRFIRVGIPFVFWVTVYLLWLNFMQYSLTLYRVIELLLSGGLDFLYFLFIILALYFIAPIFIIFISHTGKRGHTYLFVSSVIYTLFLTLSGILFSTLFVNTALSALTLFIPYIAYFLAGFYLKDKPFSKWLTLPLITVYTLIALTVAVFTNGDPVSYLKSNGGVTVMAMTFIVFTLTYHSATIKKIIRYNSLVKFIRFLAFSVFGIYLTHFFILALFDKIIPALSAPYTLSPIPLVLVMGKVLLIFLLSLAVTTVLRKIPYVGMIVGEIAGIH